MYVPSLHTSHSSCGETRRHDISLHEEKPWSRRISSRLVLLTEKPLRNVSAVSISLVHAVIYLHTERAGGVREWALWPAASRLLYLWLLPAGNPGTSPPTVSSYQSNQHACQVSGICGGCAVQFCSVEDYLPLSGSRAERVVRVHREFVLLRLFHKAAFGLSSRKKG